MCSKAVAMITLQHLLVSKRSVLRKHWDRFFHTPNIRSTIPLVQIWAMLCLGCSVVVGCGHGVSKQELWAYPLSPCSSPLCCPLSNWAHNEELWKILESCVAPFQRATMFENSKLGVHTAWTLMENQFLRFLYSSASGVDGHLISTWHPSIQPITPGKFPYL